MLTNKNKLKEYLKDVFKEIKDDKDVTNEIKQGMKTYKVTPGKVQDYINFYDKIINENIDLSILYLLAEQTYNATKNLNVDPKNYFTEREIKEIKSNFEGDRSNKVSFPYTFNNVIKVSDDDYITSIKASEIKKLMDNQLLQYNFETQREGRQIKDKKTGNIVETPKVIEKSVKEMTDLMKKGELISSMITFNARLGTSDIGEELQYNEIDKTLTITEGTLLDVLDGFHRINAIVRTLNENPSIDENFKLNILNYDKKRAQKYFSQLNTTNPISKSHLKRMSESRQSDFVAKLIQSNSELSGRVAASDRIAPESDLLVTFNVLSDGIDEVFKVENRPEAIEVSKYLTEFINNLFFAFPDEFMGNIASIRSKSLINANSMFYGYIVIAKRMRDENIPLNKIAEIVANIDFSRDNPIWKESNILDEKNRITNNAKDQIMKFFSQLDLNRFKEGVKN